MQRASVKAFGGPEQPAIEEMKEALVRPLHATETQKIRRHRQKALPQLPARTSEPVALDRWPAGNDVVP